MKPHANDMNKSLASMFAKIFPALCLPAIIYSPSAFCQISNSSEWLTSACYQINLSAFDKLDAAESHLIKYRVMASDGAEFVAERNSQPHEQQQVAFPDDFVISQLKDVRGNIIKPSGIIRAFADCNRGQSYHWAISIDGRLIDQGEFSFNRTTSQP